MYHFTPPSVPHGISADGNCQFKALSWASFGTPERHLGIRRVVCDYLDEHWDVYKDSVVRDDYVQNMRRAGEWGDHITLDAFCNAYNDHVMVLRPDSTPSLFGPRNSSESSPNYKAIIYSGSHYSACDPWFSTPTRQYIRRWQTE